MRAAVAPWAPTLEVHQRIAPDVDALPGFLRVSLLDEFYARAYDFDFTAFDRAKAWLLQAVAALRKARLSVGYDPHEINTLATQLARWSVREGSYAVIEREAQSQDLQLPKGTKLSTEESIVRRLYEPKTWRRMMHVWTRKAEDHLRKIGFVEKHAMLFVSDLAVQWYKTKIRAQESYMKNTVLDDGEGTQLTLWDVHESSISNKKNRRVELMTRMRGLENRAKEKEWVPLIITLTCPSAYHPRRAGRGANERYEGFTVGEAQGWLCKMWARSRARLHKLGVGIDGFRMVESHHDGTPHWHMVLFCAPHHAGLLHAVLQSQFMSEYAGEVGADEHRCKIEFIDERRGSATGYCSKYIAKGTDAFEVGDDDEQPGTSRNDTQIRHAAWVSMFGIRQFQQIGGAPITPYRELRRERKEQLQLELIEPVRKACDDHDFAEYIRLAKGRMSLWKEEKLTVDKPTGEMVPMLNAFGEPRGAQIIGVTMGAERLKTRKKQWIKHGSLSAISSSSKPSAEISTALSSSHFAALIVATKSSSVAALVKDLSFGVPRAVDAASGIPIESSWEQGWYQEIGMPSSDSALGPVSITVPASKGAGSLSDPHGWTNPNETSMYGPH
jgi:Bacteriophage replication gene A protein (GPA)